ncbi:MAG: hypothetical protein IJ055_04280 [Oscillospiraceae bacterium]|nr:hypothetical protein [Oscillospiraceae bacterium]
MKSNKLIGLAVFNLAFVILEIILYSRGLVNLGAQPVPALIAGVVSAAAFIGVNYCILTFSGRKKRYQPDKLHSVQDYREALEYWQQSGHPFQQEVAMAIRQLDLFYQKQTALRALLGDDARKEDNPFLSVSDDVKSALLTNMKKILNRMTILDPNEQSRYQMHSEFLHHVLGQNKQLLSQYDNLIIEISQIGDSKEMETLNLEAITNALRELRDDRPVSNLQEMPGQSGQMLRSNPEDF